MAELEEGKAEIVPAMPALAGGETAQGDFGRFMLKVRDFTPSGAKEEFSIAIKLDDPVWGPRITTAAVLKQGPAWKGFNFNYVLYAVLYAEGLGLDIMAGDVYDVNGRLNTSNKAKIKRALASGNIVGIETDIKELADPAPTGCLLKKDLECTATVHVKGWAKPIVRRARLSRWFKPSNPNWKDNPEHMLEMNTVAHACEYVAPGGTEGDEAPPPEPLLVDLNTLGKMK